VSYTFIPNSRSNETPSCSSFPPLPPLTSRGALPQVCHRHPVDMLHGTNIPGCLQKASTLDAHDEVQLTSSRDPSTPLSCSRIISSISIFISSPIVVHPNPLLAENADRLYAQADGDRVCMHPVFQNPSENHVSSLGLLFSSWRTCIDRRHMCRWSLVVKGVVIR
jgi:hypothetical protein